MAETNMADYVRRSDWQLQNKLLEANCAKKLPLSGGNVSGKLEAQELKARSLSADFAEVHNLKPAQIYSYSVEPLDEIPFVYEIVEKANQLAIDFKVNVPQLPNRPQSKTRIDLLASNVRAIARAAGLKEIADELNGDPALSKIAEALDLATVAFEKTILSENLQQSLSALGDAVASIGKKTDGARLLALDVDAKLTQLGSRKQDAGDYLTQKQIEKRFLDKTSGGAVAGDVVFSGKTTAGDVSIDSLSVDFAKFYNAAEKKDLSKYVLHLQGSTLAELQSKCNDMITYAELPLLKISPAEVATEDCGRALTIKKVNQICKVAGVEGAGAKPTEEEMRMALNRALRKLSIFGGQLSLQTILQNYQTRNLLLEAVVGHLQLQTSNEKKTLEDEMAGQASKLESFGDKLDQLSSIVGVSISHMDNFETRMMAGLTKNVELTPTKTQVARLSEELEAAKAQIAALQDDVKRLLNYR